MRSPSAAYDVDGDPVPIRPGSSVKILTHTAPPFLNSCSCPVTKFDCSHVLQELTYRQALCDMLHSEYDKSPEHHRELLVSFIGKSPAPSERTVLRRIKKKYPHSLSCKACGSNHNSPNRLHCQMWPKIYLEASQPSRFVYHLPAVTGEKKQEGQRTVCANTWRAVMGVGGGNKMVGLHSLWKRKAEREAERAFDLKKRRKLDVLLHQTIRDERRSSFSRHYRLKRSMMRRLRSDEQFWTDEQYFGLYDALFVTVVGQRIDLSRRCERLVKVTFEEYTSKITRSECV